MYCMAERRYDEKEVGAILRRAAEMQSGVEAPDAAGGLTIQELQELGREVGIDPAVLQQAALESDTPSGKKLYVSGAAGTVLIDRLIEGELSDEAWEEIVLDLRRHVGRPGADTVKGNKREWSGGFDIGSLTLTATAQGGQTRIRLFSEFAGGIGLTWLIGGVVALLASIFAGRGIARAGGSWVLIASIVLVIALATALVIHSIVRAWDRRSRPKLHALMGKIQTLAGATPEQRAAEVAQRAAETAAAKHRLL